MSTALIILAAGKGTRMESDLPKVMHELGGAPLFTHAWSHGRALEPARTVIVAGHGGADLVEAAARDVDPPEVTVVVQDDQLGTGHAVAQARAALDEFEGDAVVLYGDTPFTGENTLARLVEARKSADVVVLGFEAADPGRYGRLVMDGDRLARIVEFKDASNEERAITLCNSGVVCADASTLMDLIAAVGNDNASGEYYLTDIVKVATARGGLTATAVTCEEAETLGINTRAELTDAERIFQTRARRKAMEDGALLQSPPDTVHFSADTVIGRDAVIEPNVVFAPPGVTVESGARIRRSAIWKTATSRKTPSSAPPMPVCDRGGPSWQTAPRSAISWKSRTRRSVKGGRRSITSPTWRRHRGRSRQSGRGYGDLQL